jgi:hypothetical protein
MDIEIIVEGGKELSEWYPRHYELFEEKVGDMIVKMFPGVGSWIISPRLTARHQEEEQERQQRREQRERVEIKQALVEVLKESEFQEKIRAIRAQDQQVSDVST